jgi:hypothetical protein
MYASLAGDPAGGRRAPQPESLSGIARHAAENGLSGCSASAGILRFTLLIGKQMSDDHNEPDTGVSFRNAAIEAICGNPIFGAAEP